MVKCYKRDLGVLLLEEQFEWGLEQKGGRAECGGDRRVTLLAMVNAMMEKLQSHCSLPFVPLTQWSAPTEFF
jgi:hypothetical protein